MIEHRTGKTRSEQQHKQSVSYAIIQVQVQALPTGKVLTAVLLLSLLQHLQQTGALSDLVTPGMAARTQSAFMAMENLTRYMYHLRRI